MQLITHHWRCCFSGGVRQLWWLWARLLVTQLGFCIVERLREPDQTHLAYTGGREQHTLLNKPYAYAHLWKSWMQLEAPLNFYLESCTLLYPRLLAFGTSIYWFSWHFRRLFRARWMSESGLKSMAPVLHSHRTFTASFLLRCWLRFWLKFPRTRTYSEFDHPFSSTY